MAVELALHPAVTADGIAGVAVHLQRVVVAAAEPALQLDYRVRGVAALSSLQGARDGGRRDEIWRHTCCELFVALPGGSSYGEYNFSPRGAWAAYGFSAYRAARPQTAAVAAPVLRLATDSDSWTLQLRLPLADLVRLAGGAPGVNPALQLGLAVIVAPPGAPQQFWAAHHVAERPDFHRRESFVVEWPAC